MKSVNRRRPRRKTKPLALPQGARAFRRRLLGWYALHRRALPWRGTRDPYEVLVSEFMLQQTQVARVMGHYPRFLTRYPTLEDLAAAPPDAVRDSWSGLGYYARARNLHAAARRVVREHEGVFPTDPAELRRLPGIGRYTAGAVASIAFGADAAAVDTNIARVLSRVFRVPGARASAARLWRLAERVLPRGRAGDWNQALMDLGATICVARRPRCVVCPVESVCRSSSRIRRRDRETGP
jgi:A/G-specific adenine glycosylase